ncbi:pyruvate dehydrogenase E2 component (dihydrolipoamide acetyltransferase) [Spiroplasma sabaudiense Ar-1343]|uniref:Dihydrolipoamide acetyltransferase component of pyruvate dehydrogenase complex n=1 Tax=Spiroplasma sabaudiense Ar-1343 TaxID=1276257 RepID=W6A9F3_9MOLU|nr:dihydrolipoamide acetyltransferase family protein [Spiroplasma sabaudiense]AHI53657.1 pyruvate dehydrogenase E2 component (dihydrolipoamide acetyltransferase) [Spiroplasma sabaudiense Ar-1343]
MFKLKFADIGEGLTEGTVFKVNFKIGDKVEEGDELFTVETDKVTAEIPAPVSGIISAVNIKEGQVIKVGDVVIEIDDGSNAAATQTPVVIESAPNKAPIEEGASVVGAVPISNDLIKSRTLETKETTPSNLDIRITPLARKMAVDKKIDLSKIVGTGPYGRILVEDLKIATNNQNNLENVASVTTPSKTPEQSVFVPEFASVASNEVVRKPMSGIRKAIARAMVNSSTTIPAVTLTKTVDISKIVNLKKDLKNSILGEAYKITYLPLIVKAVTTALQEFNNINVSLDGDDILIKKFFNIGIAVDTERGLVVPVVKSANLKSVLQIATNIRDLAQKAKTNTLTPDDMKGGTFTITNFGSAGIEFGTPIINFPEAAILGVGTIVEQLGFGDNDEIIKKSMLPLSITVDHRIIDGADGGRFLSKVALLLENPLALLIN